MVSRWSRVKAGCAFALACVLPCAFTPGAFAADDGRWPVANDVVAAAWKQGIDGSGVKVAVLDSQAVEDYPALKDADITYRLGRFSGMGGNEVECKVGGRPLTATIKAGDDGYYSSHGTDMLSWIVGDGGNYTLDKAGMLGAAPKARILHITTMGTSATAATTLCDAKKLGDASSDNGADVRTAVDWGARIINRSQSGGLDDTDYAGYVDALRHGIIMVGARANDTTPGLDDLTGDPRSMETFPGVVMVNSVDESGTLASTSDVMDGNVAVLSYGANVLKPINYVAEGDNRVGNGGTSTAAAVLSSYLALAMQKWPDATGNQIIQSLIRNTKSGKGKPVIDPERKRGFGEVDLNALLTVDPTQYKDVNPILEYQMKAAAQYPALKDWYTQDCKTNPDGIGDAADGKIPCEAGLIGQEYERQQTAWKKVEQCRSDGGSDCMQYSATNTADGSTNNTATPNGQAKPEGDPSQSASSGMPVWLWGVIGAGVAAIATGVIIALVVSRRRRTRVRIPVSGVAYGSVRSYPNGPVPSRPYPQQVPRQGFAPPQPYPPADPAPGVPAPDNHGGNGNPADMVGIHGNDHSREGPNRPLLSLANDSRICLYSLTCLSPKLAIARDLGSIHGYGCNHSAGRLRWCSVCRRDGGSRRSKGIADYAEIVWNRWRSWIGEQGFDRASGA